MVKNVPANARDNGFGFKVYRGRRHMPQGSLCAVITKARMPRACALQEKPLQREACVLQQRVVPARCSERKALTATKTQHGQN